MLNFEMLTLPNALNEDIKKGLEMRVQMLYPQMSLHLTNMQCHSGRHIKTFDNRLHKPCLVDYILFIIFVIFLIKSNIMPTKI